VNLTEPITEPEILEIEGNLNDEQSTRVAALEIAKPLLTHSGIASRTPPTVDDLITLAEWIVKGGDTSPLYPYADSDGTVHLGPNVWMKPEGFLWVSGSLYEPSSEDGHDEDDVSQGPEKLGGMDA
jgi:hypothetical protein